MNLHRLPVGHVGYIADRCIRYEDGKYIVSKYIPCKPQPIEIFQTEICVWEDVNGRYYTVDGLRIEETDCWYVDHFGDIVLTVLLLIVISAICCFLYFKG